MVFTQVTNAPNFHNYHPKICYHLATFFRIIVPIRSQIQYTIFLKFRKRFVSSLRRRPTLPTAAKLAKRCLGLPPQDPAIVRLQSCANLLGAMLTIQYAPASLLLPQRFLHLSAPTKARLCSFFEHFSTLIPPRRTSGQGADIRCAQFSVSGRRRTGYRYVCAEHILEKSQSGKGEFLRRSLLKQTFGDFSFVRKVTRSGERNTPPIRKLKKMPSPVISGRGRNALNQPGGQVMSRPERTWKCRCATLCPACSPMLDTTR